MNGVGKRRSQATLRRGLKALGPETVRGLRFVCSDMWKPYLQMIAAQAGQALHVLDRFHITTHLNRGVDQVRRAESSRLRAAARQLNPHHPGWYWLPSFFDAYRKSDYRAALDAALNINMPGFWRANLALAATYGQLGEREAARNALHTLLTVKPECAVAAREELGKSWDPELVGSAMRQR